MWGLLNKISAKYFKRIALAAAGRVHAVTAAMKEIKSDISNHIPKWFFDYLDNCIDIVITVCDDAELAFFIFPKKP